MQTNLLGTNVEVKPKEGEAPPATGPTRGAIVAVFVGDDGAPRAAVLTGRGNLYSYPFARLKIGA